MAKCGEHYSVVANWTRCHFEVEWLTLRHPRSADNSWWFLVPKVVQQPMLFRGWYFQNRFWPIMTYAYIPQQISDISEKKKHKYGQIQGTSQIWRYQIKKVSNLPFYLHFEKCIFLTHGQLANYLHIYCQFYQIKCLKFVPHSWVLGLYTPYTGCVVRHYTTICTGIH